MYCRLQAYSSNIDCMAFVIFAFGNGIAE
jgi:hypothetical protein